MDVLVHACDSSIQEAEGGELPLRRSAVVPTCTLSPAGGRGISSFRPAWAETPSQGTRESMQ